MRRAIYVAVTAVFSVLLFLCPCGLAKGDDVVLAQKVAFWGGMVSHDAKAPGRPIVGVHIMFGDSVDDCLKDIAPHCQNLRSFQLFDGEVTRVGLKQLATLKNLRELGLTMVDVKGEDLRDLLPALTNLEKLHLSSCEVPSADLGGLPNMRHLKELTLSLLDDGHQKLLPRCLNLRTLSLIGEANIDPMLKNLPRLPNLRVLRLDNADVTAVGLKELSRLENLEELSLTTTSATVEGLKQLAALKKLRKLDLWGAT